MPTLKEMRAQHAKMVEDARALMPADSKALTSELRTKIETQMADAVAYGKLVAQFAETETAENKAETENRSQFLADVNTGTKVVDDETKQRKLAAYRSFLRTGKVETRELSVSADGVLIPEFVGETAVALKDPGAVYNTVGRFQTSTGAPMKVPYWNDLANSWVLNSTAISTTDPAVTQGPTVAVDDLRYNPVLLDNSLIADSAFDVVKQVNSDIYTRYVRSISNFITNGNGSNIAALTSNPNKVAVKTSGTIAYGDVVTLVTSLDPAYYANAVLMYSTLTQANVLEIVDGNQRPIFQPYGAAPTQGVAGGILGFPVKFNQYLPVVAAGNVAMQFGDFAQGYKFREVNPVESNSQGFTTQANGAIYVKFLDQLYAAQNQVAYVAFARGGGVLVDPGSHPILSLQC